MPPRKIPPPPPVPRAVMNIAEDEEIAGGWLTPHLPGIGIYKLLAKKKKGGAYEWAHFVQREGGLKENVYPGTVDSRERLDEVLDALNAALRKAFGPHVQMKQAGADAYSLDGRKASGTIH